MRVRTYITKWPSADNVVISLQGAFAQVGIIEMRIFKDGEHNGEAYLWNLHVRDECRKKGFGRTLLVRALSIARARDCKIATLDWDIKEAPRWVRDWYEREGFEEKEFGRDCAFMVKTLKEEKQ